MTKTEKLLESFDLDALVRAVAVGCVAEFCSVFYWSKLIIYSSENFGYFPRLFGVQPSGAREMLAVIASFDDHGCRNGFFDHDRRFNARFDAVFAAHFA